MSTYIIVRDGQTTWVADRAELFAAMDKIGFKIQRNLAVEPKHDPSEGESPYGELCQMVQPVDIAADDQMATCEWSDSEHAWILS